MVVEPIDTSEIAFSLAKGEDVEAVTRARDETVDEGNIQRACKLRPLCYIELVILSTRRSAPNLDLQPPGLTLGELVDSLFPWRIAWGKRALVGEVNVKETATTDHLAASDEHTPGGGIEAQVVDIHSKRTADYIRLEHRVDVSRGEQVVGVKHALAEVDLTVGRQVAIVVPMRQRLPRLLLGQNRRRSRIVIDPDLLVMHHQHLRRREHGVGRQQNTLLQRLNPEGVFDQLYNPGSLEHEKTPPVSKPPTAAVPLRTALQNSSVQARPRTQIAPCQHSRYRSTVEPGPSLDLAGSPA